MINPWLLTVFSNKRWCFRFVYYVLLAYQIILYCLIPKLETVCLCKANFDISSTFCYKWLHLFPKFKSIWFTWEVLLTFRSIAISMRAFSFTFSLKMLYWFWKFENRSKFVNKYWLSRFFVINCWILFLKDYVDILLQTMIFYAYNYLGTNWTI